MWPRLSPHELLHDLFGAPPLIAAAGRGVLTPEEQAAPPPPAVGVVRRGGLDAGRCRPGRRGPPPPRPPRTAGGDDGVRKYGHIVVDEVQDLSPMQLRMLTRRSLSGSMTVVGDIAQATAPWAPASWDGHHRAPAPPPAGPNGGADRELPDPGRGAGRGQPGAGRGRPRAQPAPAGAPHRRGAEDDRRPGLRRVAAGGNRRRPGPQRWPRWRARRWPRSPRAGWPSSPPSRCWPSCRRRWPPPACPVVDARDMRKGGLFEPLVLLAADAANGLEFDSVVVVEPGADRR